MMEVRQFVRSRICDRPTSRSLLSKCQGRNGFRFQNFGKEKRSHEPRPRGDDVVGL
jgi:hypothetical protein